jgi:hypothetical protein
MAAHARTSPEGWRSFRAAIVTHSAVKTSDGDGIARQLLFFVFSFLNFFLLGLFMFFVKQPSAQDQSKKRYFCREKKSRKMEKA